MQKALHMALIQASGLHRQISRQKFQELDLSEGQPKILMHLLSDNGILQKELSKRCGVRPATMTSLLQKMQQDDLIYKEEIHVSGGKRGYLIFLSDHGRELAYQVIEIVDQVEQISFKGFSESEKKLLVKLLDRVSGNLTDQIE